MYRIILNYLLLEQWQPPPEDDFRAKSPEKAESWHLFRWVDESGGFPAEIAGGATGGRPIFDPCLPFETLPSPVMDDINDDVDDVGGDTLLKESLGFLLAGVHDELDFTRLIFPKSNVRDVSGLD